MGLSYCFTSCSKYEAPGILKDMGLDDGERIIKASNGLDLSELKQEGLGGHSTKSIMFQWGHGGIFKPRNHKKRIGLCANKQYVWQRIHKFSKITG